MKKILIMLLTCLGFSLVINIPTILAKTATVTYSYDDWANHTVCIYVSETPDIATHQTATGQCDMEDDGVVEIGNIQTGMTYYFAPVGYDKVTGARTMWGDEVAQLVPAEVLPDMGELPPIIEVPFGTFTLDSVTYKAN
ncbi:MAG: hypothetical protein GQ540_03725 [Lutibacter sp.]|uniref:hypothetical protein n=1 Tax=Lutibacter sp. TaxID=1925666 RepID=UPI0019E9EA52|nr:hypothetical protein [Lutibacter sp.]NOR27622.1 hypothetical protein [Lutibacter sp.]